MSQHAKNTTHVTYTLKLPPDGNGAHTHQTMPWAPEPMARNCWYLFSTVKVESPTWML